MYCVYHTNWNDNVMVTSSSQEKLERARELGALGGYQYSQDDWEKQILREHGMVDAVIDGAGGTGGRSLRDLV